MVYKKNMKSRIKGSFERGREQGRENLRIKKIIKKEVAEDEFERGYYRPNKAVKKIAELSVSAEDKLHKTGKFAKRVGKKLKPVGKVLYDVAEIVTRPPKQSKRSRAHPPKHRIGDRGYDRKSSIYDDDNDFEDMVMGWRESEEYRPFGKPFGERKESRLKSNRGPPTSFNPASTIIGAGMQVEGGSRHLIGDIPRQSYGVSGSLSQTVSAILDLGKPKSNPAPRNIAFIDPKFMEISVSRSRPVGSIESILNTGLNSAAKPKSKSKKTK